VSAQPCCLHRRVHLCLCLLLCSWSSLPRPMQHTAFALLLIQPAQIHAAHALPSSLLNRTFGGPITPCLLLRATQLPAPDQCTHLFSTAARTLRGDTMTPSRMTRDRVVSACASASLLTPSRVAAAAGGCRDTHQHITLTTVSCCAFCGWLP
jgi:hypothetical protein